MRYHVHVFRVFLLIVCLCAFGSTKSGNAFDFSKSTRIQANVTGEVVSTNTEILTKAQFAILVTPPQPRNTRGEFVCTRNRYIPHERQTGKASWYGGIFHEKQTASGEKFNQDAYTLAHLTLPMGTEVLVENPESKVVLRARVNDCGPFVKGRIADLSRGLAKDLGLLDRGSGTIILTVL